MCQISWVHSPITLCSLSYSYSHLLSCATSPVFPAMDFFSTDSDKFAKSSPKTVTTTRTTVSVRREERPSQAKKPRRDAPSQAHAQRVNVLKRERTSTPVQIRPASRTSTPVSTNKQPTVNSPRKRQRRSPSASSSSSSSASSPPPENENARQRSTSPSRSPGPDFTNHASRQLLTEASPITRQVFRPSLIHSDAYRNAPATDARWRGFIPSTSIVSDHLPKYRSCSSVHLYRRTRY